MKLSNCPTKVLSTAILHKLEFASGSVRVYIPTHPSAVALATSRDVVGEEKIDLYQDTLARTLAFCWPDVAREEGIGGAWPLVSMRRGGEWIRSKNIGSMMGQPILDVGLKAQRFRDNVGRWQVQIDEANSSRLELLDNARTIGLLDECAASGATLSGTFLRLKERVPSCEKWVVICPFVGDIALRRLFELDMPITVFTFGIFKTMPIGWEETETDIVIPFDDELDNEFVRIPDEIWNACDRVYGCLNGRTMCLAGNASWTMSTNQFGKIGNLIWTGKEWLVFNRTMPSLRLWTTLLALIRGLPVSEGAKREKMESIKRLVENGPNVTDRAAGRDVFDQMAQLWRSMGHEFRG